MPKLYSDHERISQAEFDALPVVVDVATAARVLGCCTRHIQRHPEECGAVKVCGRWQVSKTRLAQALGINC